MRAKRQIKAENEKKKHSGKVKKEKGKKNNGMKSRILNFIILAVLFLGIVLMAYPAISNLLNERNQSKSISNYDHVLKDMSAEEKAKMWDEAVKYNQDLAHGIQGNNYNDILNVTGTGIMGYVKIPKIHLELPIYHGTSEGVLRTGVGHLENTSFPTGGKGTHCAISGHTGLPSSKMFTNVEKLKKGDMFILKSVDHTMTYQVDQIKVVLPDETKDLEIDPNKDYCTLITCTPYGVNSHRLLIRGIRTANIIPEPNIGKIDVIAITMLVFAGILLVVFIKEVKNLRKKRRKKLE